MITRRELHQGWTFSEVGSDEWLPASVPGCVQLDLLDAERVPDPFYRMDEFEMQRLEPKDWEYRTSFLLSAEDLEASALELVFEGLDTYADVYLNETYLGPAANMFIPHRYDVTEVAVAGDNLLRVRFYSPLNTIKTLERNSPLVLRSSTETARPYIRKAQYAYGWDWGPRIAQVGPWRPVALEIVREARLHDPYLYVESLEGSAARVHLQVGVESYTDEPLEVEFELSLGDAEAATIRVPVALHRGTLAAEAAVTVPDAQLWWPNGMGAQPLYTLRARLYGGERLLEEHALRSGLRTVGLRQEADAEGRTFVVEINGVPVFCKGANWIPADSLLPRLTHDDYYEYIRLAADAHMNMLRIWGGGIYEDPAFYQACDELGIMVWQDFMYSCAQYPDELDWFQETAREEAEAVVRGLRNHPSIVIWCGNNENNWGFDEWWGNGVPKYLGNYVYREILPEVCAALDPSRPYWVSSPYGGDKPNSQSEGDCHEWRVWSNWQDYDGYRGNAARFASEFGFQAMPDWRTVLSYTAPEDRSILSPVMRSHNKMAEGMERLSRFMVGRLGFPVDLKAFVYLSQFNQAEAIRTAVEHWRSRMFRTAGALYWQINDCWPVASWSCLDYYKRKKALYHYTRRFFAPVLPVIRATDGGVEIMGVSDLRQPAKATVRVRAYGFDGTLLGQSELSATLLANAATPLGTIPLDDLGIGYAPRLRPVDIPGCTVPMEGNGALMDAVVYVDLAVGEQVYTNYAVFERFRALNLRQPEVRTTLDGGRLTLESDVPAFGVFIETENEVDLSDNCLNLEPGRPVTVSVAGDPGAASVVDLTRLVSGI